ncbi:MAG TPA: glycosyltransferase family 39 protein [Burkholderiales bacterium]|nr:glycosyltransferase family 39 protein [Burkholderiales bacterium]
MVKLLNKSLLGSKQLRFLIIVAIIANCFGLLFPILGSNDANFYSVIAKHIVISNDWVNLTFANKDWLDKPHFPFWVTAIFYKIFGINSFAYILPGFLFNLLGAYYTYLLTKKLYNKEVGLMACLLYLTTLHLMLSSIDVRAEAFLLGEIMPACYYWFLYNENEGINKKYLFLGSLFTAFAIMTKGVFTLLPITSGLIIGWIFNKQFNNYKKWLFALLLLLIFILPEVISLYYQCDAHPEKEIFGQFGVSGIKFFFCDSQFGRFFDFGPIVKHSTSIAHYFFFMHTFLWAFLPWWPIFFVAIWSIFKDFRVATDPMENNQYKYIYLLGSFFPTFILFSCSSFQLDHYTNIIFPFAAIICANWIENKATRLPKHIIYRVQVLVSFILVIAITVLSVLLFNSILLIAILSVCILVLLLFIILIHNYGLTKAIVYPFLAINLAFVFIMLINGKIYDKYDAGYQIAKYLKKEPAFSLIDYQVNYSSLEFHLDKNDKYQRVEDIDKLLEIEKPYYLVINANQWEKIKQKFLSNTVIKDFNWIRQEKFISTLFNKDLKEANTEKILLIKILK